MPASLSSTTIIPNPQTPTFERTADETIERSQAIYKQRGVQYSDTWALENLTTAVTRSVLQRFGIQGLRADELRLLLLAALIDVKDSRLIGGWNPDSLYDGIAYRASFTTLRDEYERREAVAVRPEDPSTV